MKVGIIRCMQTEDYCPGTTDFKIIREKRGAFEGIEEDIEIVGYQVIVEQEEPLRVFSIDLPASVTSVMVPPEFFHQKNTLHKFEVLAIEASKNQTITSGEFITLPE